MILLTEKIKKALPALYSTEKIPVYSKLVICKFFVGSSNFTWYVFEGDFEKNGDCTFFGMAFGQVAELGYFNLFELLKVRTPPHGFSVERDRSVFKVPYYLQVKKDCLDYVYPNWKFED